MNNNSICQLPIANCQSLATGHPLPGGPRAVSPRFARRDLLARRRSLTRRIAQIQTVCLGNVSEHAFRRTLKLMDGNDRGRWASTARLLLGL